MITRFLLVTISYWFRSISLIPRVSHATAPGGDKMRDPGNEVAVYLCHSQWYEM